jgi:hypothetical protein
VADGHGAVAEVDDLDAVRVALLGGPVVPVVPAVRGGHGAGRHHVNAMFKVLVFIWLVLHGPPSVLTNVPSLVRVQQRYREPRVYDTPRAPLLMERLVHASAASGNRARQARRMEES